MSARYIVGDALSELRKLPDGSVDLVLSSPPFLALRSYLPADHPDKAREIGSEATPGEFLDVLLDVVVECRRVLAPHGSLVFELGDTYSGASGWASAGDDAWSAGPDRMRATEWRSRPDKGGTGPGWPLDKSKVLIPELFAVALAYGFNPLTGRTIEPWRVRNVVAWCRPNPPVGALGDKYRPATSFLTVACVGRDRWFDLDAVREPPLHPEKGTPKNGARDLTSDPLARYRGNSEFETHPAGAPPLDYWEIPTSPYKGAHYATWPPELCVRPIKSMCPLRVCRVCGQPSRRIVEASYEDGNGNPAEKGEWSSGIAECKGAHSNKPTRLTATPKTLGWTECGHNDWRAGVVLDPFAGSGTTLMVATGHGRDAIGIDLDARNLELARERLGMFLVEAA